MKMIDLRQGNYVMMEIEGEPTMMKVICLEREAVFCCEVEDEYEGMSKGAHFTDVRPVKVTKELLKEMGFTPTEEGDLTSYRKDDIKVNHLPFKGFVFVYKDKVWIQLDGLHHLQNLVMELYKSELRL